MENILLNGKNRKQHKMDMAKSAGFICEENPLAEFLELCIQSGLQFENSERADMLDKAIDYAIEKRII